MIRFIFNNQDLSTENFGMVLCHEAGKPDEVQFFTDEKEVRLNAEQADIQIHIVISEKKKIRKKSIDIGEILRYNKRGDNRQ